MKDNMICEEGVRIILRISRNNEIIRDRKKDMINHINISINIK